jgi:hypothetical protein
VEADQPTQLSWRVDRSTGSGHLCHASRPVGEAGQIDDLDCRTVLPTPACRTQNSKA